MEEVAGVILAGGLSRRMGGGDKGLRNLRAKPLMAHAIERLSPQASPIAVNANGDPSRFSGFGLPVVADAVADYSGPLAGVLAGLRWASAVAPDARYIVTAACDTPFFPKDLVARFLAEAGNTYPAIVLAQSGGQIHPVFGLWPISLADDLANAIATGTRKVLHWTDRHIHFTAEFELASLGGQLIDPFFNANTPQELEAAEQLLMAEREPR